MFSEVICIMKMRVLYFPQKNKKIADIAEHLSKNSDDYKADKIPPDYSLDKERLLVLGVSVGAKLPDDFRRFCSNLTAERAKNIAVYSDSSKENTEALISLIKEHGGNVVGDVFYVKSSFLALGKASAEEKAQADSWFDDVLKLLK